MASVCVKIQVSLAIQRHVLQWKQIIQKQDLHSYVSFIPRNSFTFHGVLIIETRVNFIFLIKKLNHRVASFDHGPCLSNHEKTIDMVFCLHSKSWINQAKNWITRSHNSWPDAVVKQSIIDHGVLFVPIGAKGSPNEEKEWRISFAVGERFLIYTFNHTQLICYVLMKILLKDIIATDYRCKDLLCSYFMKTLIFWVSEEISFSKWCPKNTVRCFMQCFRRLIYYVKYSSCPHYFIPENNMFENRIEGWPRHILLENLMLLYTYGWRCILFSKNFCHCHFNSIILKTMDKFDYLSLTIKFIIPCKTPNPGVAYFQNAVKLLCSCKSAIVKYLLFFCSSNGISQSISINDTHNNKQQYKQYKACQSYILQCRGTDAVSRWLLLSSLFYRMKSYDKALDILEYTLSKCTPEKKILLSVPPDLHCFMGELHNLQDLIRLRQMLYLDDILFVKKSTLIPSELELEVTDIFHEIPPVVYAHFLSLLCDYHLGNYKQCDARLIHLLHTVQEEYSMTKLRHLPVSYNCAGIALQLLGYYDMARLYYIKSVLHGTEFSFAWKRFTLLNENI